MNKLILILNLIFLIVQVNSLKYKIRIGTENRIFRDVDASLIVKIGQLTYGFAG